MIKIILI